MSSDTFTSTPKTTRSSWNFFKRHRILPNPGKFEDIQREPRTIFFAQEIFDGAKFEFIKSIGSGDTYGFSITHSFTLGSKEEAPGYILNAAYGTDKFILNGRISPDLKLHARYSYQFTPNWAVKIMAQASPSDQEPSAWTTDLDYKGGDYYASVKVGLPLVLGLSYMQSITPKLSLGCEGVYQNTYRMSLASFAARYEGKNFVATGLVNNDLDLDLTYAKNINERLAFCTELMYSNMKKVTSASIGFDYTLSHSKMRATIESNGRILAWFEEKLTGANFILCAELDHVKKDYNFGVGLNI